MENLKTGRVDQIEELRRIMGTHPDEQPELKTTIYRGVEGIEVKFIEGSKNPYKEMYTLATSCWGKEIDKWDSTPVEARFKVVKAVLEGDSLPLALEAPKFTFAVEGASRSSFDQIARARLGVVFSSMGTRDNNHKDGGVRIPEELWDEENRELFYESIDLIGRIKELYANIVDKGQGSWQTARFILPMSFIHRYSMSINYAALRNLCANRMKFCEQADTVATAWLLREALFERFPLLAVYLRPRCDWSGKCQYRKAYSMSEAFGALFAPCGRNECDADYEYATFNQSCSDSDVIAEQLKIFIPSANEEMPKNMYPTYDSLSYIDKALFEQ